MLADLHSKYSTELFESVIPFWLRHSLDREHGGYFTCLDRDGDVFDTRKYVWMQGRAVWTFSRLYNTVERREEWLDAAGLILRFLRAYGKDAQGRYYFSLTREGRPVFYQRKPYAAVFAALGLIEYSKTGAADYLDEAESLFQDIQRWIAQPDLLGRPALAGAPDVIQLADVMVVALIALELANVRPKPEYDAILAKCLDDALVHYDASRGILLENRAPKDLPEGRLVCPGSALEVAWFLLHILARMPDTAKQRQVLDVIEASLEFGWDREFGGLYYFMDADGQPPLQLESNMKLWWPHTEALYALVLAQTLSPERRWLDWLGRVDEYAFRTFADPEQGEWYGYCDRRGAVALASKGGPYKGFFHVPRFLLFSIQAIERAQSKAG